MKLLRNRLTFLHSILILAPLLSAFAQPVANEKYVIDSKASVIKWKCHMQFVPMNGHHGYISVSKSELIVEKNKLVGGSVEIDMNTITDERHESDNDLVDHLKSPDFFDAKKFPTSALAITAVTSGEGGNVNITGNMTIKGITQPVTFPAKAEVKDGILSANGKIIIDRTKWDVRYGSGKFFSDLANETISDEITIEVNIAARKK